jgi:hypothetical protein
MTATTAREVQGAAAGGSRACQRTHRGRATTTHTAPTTTVGHHSEGLVAADALACRAGRACVEKSREGELGAFGFLGAIPGHGLGRYRIGTASRSLRHTFCLQQSFSRGIVQKIQVAPTFVAAFARDGS